MEAKDNGELLVPESGSSEEQAPETSTPGVALTLEEQLAAKEKEARENWDRFLRERADLEN